MDVLADVLASTGIGGTVFARSELAGPWGMDFEPASRAVFHVVAEGHCWLRMRGSTTPLRLGPGDVVLLPHGEGHALLSEPGARALPLAEFIRRGRVCLAQGSSGEVRMSIEGQNPGAVLLCGAYRFDSDGVHPLLSLLPPLVHLRADSGQVAGPLRLALELLVAEYAQPGPGSATVTGRLVDVLFIHLIRAWLQQQPEGSAGWLGAVRDAQVGRVLSLMHAEPRRDWTLEALAAEVATSRATLSRRFRQLVGEPPLEYLTRWRMDLAARLLRDTPQPLAAIAERVGYSSEFAFNRTFHRVRGLPPGRYREEVRQERASSAPGEPPPWPQARGAGGSRTRASRRAARTR